MLDKDTPGAWNFPKSSDYESAKSDIMAAEICKTCKIDFYPNLNRTVGYVCQRNDCPSRIIYK